MLSIVASRIISPYPAELIIKNGASIASNLIFSIKYLSNVQHSDNELSELLTSSDLLEDIGIIKSFIEEKKLINESTTVSLCLDNLNQSLKQLEDNINSITMKIENHKKLWFGYFRSYNISEEKRLIPRLVKQMKHRFELLIEISSVI